MLKYACFFLTILNQVNLLDIFGFSAPCHRQANKEGRGGHRQRVRGQKNRYFYLHIFALIFGLCESQTVYFLTEKKSIIKKIKINWVYLYWFTHYLGVYWAGENMANKH